ncbi:uncharacterized protein EV420DRAFT_60453 [Desarmillaria tabescens]|uniref:Uncharacterized protein n=1 Tax=Armillaria tabescens TaxID=1929756 RepID=A0AA39NQ38_ARMTA|nr:uncharacterized protein EV420DRAFT_60453 [Desarmillaria tabescens]KAK0469743.1 hypothetical protein EV420DRAFT_60453 [Desarmillaria tabescens]
MILVGRVVRYFGGSILIYQPEIAEPHIRERLVSLQRWSMTCGILTQHFIQFGFSYIDEVTSFHIPWDLWMIPATILSVGMSVLSENSRPTKGTISLKVQLSLVVTGSWEHNSAVGAATSLLTTGCDRFQQWSATPAIRYSIVVCNFALTMGPASPLFSFAKAVDLAAATSWMFNFALVWGTPPPHGQATLRGRYTLSLEH